jgi:hypothetical protein
MDKNPAGVKLRILSKRTLSLHSEDIISPTISPVEDS